jgi:hypothetical protein
MSSLLRIIFGLVFSVLILGPVTACTDAQTAPVVDAPAQPDKAALLQVIADNDAAMESGDWNRIIDLTMPIQLLQALSASEGMGDDITVDEVRAELVQGIELMMNAAEITRYDMDSSGPVKTTAAGRAYMLMPIVMEMQFNGPPLRSTGEMLALADDGQWFLVNPADKETIDIIRSAYPDFEDIEIAPNTIEILK